MKKFRQVVRKEFWFFSLRAVRHNAVYFFRTSSDRHDTAACKLLTNGSLADANQVMSNFNTIVTGVNTNGAKNGANSDITSLSALTTPITPVQGGSNVYIGTGGGTANAQSG